MKAVTLLSARLTEMSAADVAAAVGAEAMATVRREDNRPMFVELIVAHEGVSTGALTGGALAGRVGRPAKKIWSRERVSELAARLAPGAPVFTGHGGSGRRPVGKMLAAAERVIAGALSAAGIAWISDPATKDRLRAGELSTCSIEAEVELSRAAGDENWVVGAVRRVTGVALGDRNSRPGFPHATVLRVIEEFDEPAAPATPPPAEETEKRPRGVLAAELAAIRAELKELRAELKNRDRVPPDPPRRVPAPPERERPAVNPLIPK